MAWCFLLLTLTLTSGAPYGGWGPGEDQGNTGEAAPPANPNAPYGYDYHGRLSDFTDYGRMYNRHRDQQVAQKFRTVVGPIVFLDHDNSLYYRRDRPFEDFYLGLEALFGRYQTPSIAYSQ